MDHHNEVLYLAAAALVSSTFSAEALAPLVKAANEAGCAIDEEMLHHEIPIAQAIIKSSMQNVSENDTQLTVTANCAAKLLNQPSNENLLKLYRFTLTMSLDTAEAERSFFPVKRLLTDYRRSMTHDRLHHLVVLSHEKKLLQVCL